MCACVCSNAAQETERKEHYERLYRRTKAQIEEEEMLIEEMKKIEKAQKKLQADRQKVAKLTQSIIAMPGTEPLPPPLEPPTVPPPLPLPYSPVRARNAQSVRGSSDAFRAVCDVVHRNEGRNRSRTSWTCPEAL